MAFAPTGALIDRESVRFHEIISNSLDYFLPVLDPVWEGMIKTSQGVGPVNDLSRDMKIIKPFTGGFAGVIEQAWPRGDFPIYGDSTQAWGSKLFTQSAAQTFPDALYGPKNLTYRLGIPMRAMLTNLAMSLSEQTAEASPNFVGQVLAPRFKAFAKNMAHTLCNYWWVSQNTGYALSYFSTSGSLTGTWDGTAKTITFQPGNQATERFFVGQRVDVIIDSTGTANSYVAPHNTTVVVNSGKTNDAHLELIVTKVDELTNTVVLQYNTSLGVNVATGDIKANGGLATSTSYWVTYANSRSSTTFGGGSAYFTGIAGINSWLKEGDSNGSTFSTSNTLLGAEYDSSNAINVNVHPEFKSFAATSVGSLTENKLKLYLRRFHAAKGRYGMTIDTLVASDGVWAHYETQKVGQWRIDRTTASLPVGNEGSDGSFSFTADGKTYKGYTSNYIENGVVYGLKKGNNNWKKYVPPGPKGTRSSGEGVNMDSGIPFEFVVPALTGGSSVKWPYMLTSGSTSANLTEYVQMPGWLRMQLVPDQPAMLKLSGVTEDRYYMS